MEIVITIKETKDGSIANIKADFSLSFESVKDAENWSQEFLKNPKDLILCKLVSAEDAAHFFASIEDTEKRAESCKSDIERMEIECDCQKCREEKEAEKAKPEPEELAPAWTPEVGMICKSVNSLFYTEIFEINETHVRTGSTEMQVYDRIEKDWFIKGWAPCAELEGLEEGDKVYSLGEYGMAHEFLIDQHYDNAFWLKSNSLSVRSNKHGIPLHFGNGKQMFWRTKERAERFGK